MIQANNRPLAFLTLVYENVQGITVPADHIQHIALQQNHTLFWGVDQSTNGNTPIAIDESRIVDFYSIMIRPFSTVINEDDKMFYVDERQTEEAFIKDSILGRADLCGIDLHYEDGTSTLFEIDWTMSCYYYEQILVEKNTEQELFEEMHHSFQETTIDNDCWVLTMDPRKPNQKAKDYVEKATQ